MLLVGLAVWWLLFVGCVGIAILAVVWRLFGRLFGGGRFEVGRGWF